MKRPFFKAAVCALACLFPVAALCGCGENAEDTALLNWIASMVNNHYYKEVSTENIYDYTAKEFVAEYLDQYSAYYTAEEYAAVVKSNEGSKSGFGFSYTYIDTRGVLVSAVIFNSPSYISGLRPGEYILSAVCGGEETVFTSGTQFSNFLSSLSTGDEVTFVTTGGSYTMAKSEYTASYVTFATNESSWAFITGDDGTLTLTESTSDVIEDLPDGAGYICLSQFYGDAGSEFAQAVETLNSCNCTSIIIDLRGNGGGYVQTMQYISACFIDSGETVMTATYKSGSEQTYAADSKYITSDECKVKEGTDVYVLANSSTASASEALIGALISYDVIDYSDIYLSDFEDEFMDLVEINTARTYGKGIMQTTYTRNSTGDALKLTVAQIYWPNGNTIHGTGITVADGANAVSAPHPQSGIGTELSSAIKLIYNL